MKVDGASSCQSMLCERSQIAFQKTESFPASVSEHLLQSLHRFCQVFPEAFVRRQVVCAAMRKLIEKFTIHLLHVAADGIDDVFALPFHV